MVSVVIPAYNEAESIGWTVRTVSDAMARLGFEYELVIADDGSTDGTADAAMAAGDGHVRVVGYGANAGKGKAVRTGILASVGDRVVCTDADLAYGTDIFGTVLGMLGSGSDLAVGSRHMAGSGWAEYPWFRKAASGCFHAVVGAASGLPYDTQCGIKGYRGGAARELYSRCVTDGFSFDFEVLMRADRMGLRVDEFPASVVNFRGSKVRLFRDSFRMFRDVFRIRRMLRSESA